MAVDALIGALRDPSGSVRLASVTAMGKDWFTVRRKPFQTSSNATNRILLIRRTVIRTLGCIGSDSAEAIDFLIDVVRGGKGGAVRPLDSEKTSQQLSPRGHCDARQDRSESKKVHSDPLGYPEYCRF